MSLWILIWQFVRRHQRAYLMSAAMLLCVTLLSVSIPRLIGHVIDDLIAHRLTAPQLLYELSLPLCAGVGMYFLRVGWRMQLFAASYRLGMELRNRLFQQLTIQGPAFYSRQRTGDLMAMATNDIDAIELAAGEAMLAGFDGTTTLLIVLAMMFIGIDWRLALASLLPFPAMAFAFWYISNKIHYGWQDALARFSALNEHTQESLAGVRTLRALGLEQRNSEEFNRLAQAASDASLNAQSWEAAYEPAVGITLTIASSAALLLGGYLLWQHEITVGSLTAFSLYLGNLIWPMFAAGWVLSLIERGRAAWARLQPIIDAPAEILDHGTQELEPGAAIQFDHVNFRYPESHHWALHGLTISLKPGETLGVVGPTGSGKSSLLRLLLRQYAVGQGRILWAEHGLDDYRLVSLRKAISWVPQESFLFSASIADNIALACPTATRSDVERAARLASIHDDILRFPQGYDTMVGERGITLSGGQKQRVSIARALLAPSKLLLLDDALSAVDTDTETQILRHLLELRRADTERMAVIVSHRLSAVIHADHIVVLHAGHVIERGNHEQLLAHQGWYARQWRYQQLEASLDAI